MVKVESDDGESRGTRFPFSVNFSDGEPIHFYLERRGREPKDL